MPQSSAPLMIVVGGDALALSTAQEICQLHGHRVVVLWDADDEFARAVVASGATFVAGRPESRDGLTRAGVREAVTILALSRDDRLNLQTALWARDANPRIRVVLRQLNRALARKIEQNLTNCSVVSLAWHSAATYAAAALDPSCVRGLQFPEPAGPLTGFALRSAESAGIAGRTVLDAEKGLNARIVAVDGNTALTGEETLTAEARLVVFGEVARLTASSPCQPPERRRGSAISRLHAKMGALRRLHHRRRIDPIPARLALAALALFAFGTWHFHQAFKTGWLAAAYFVVTTMTTTGFGDLKPNMHSVVDLLSAMLLMAGGITFSGLFIAFFASRLTRMQWVSMQGLRRVRRRGHIVVCGAGSIGSGVIELLLGFGRPLVVVEAAPDPSLAERARDQGFDLLTGDASRDETLDLCNLAAAHSLVALTNVDTLNLEIALGGRARNPSMPIVLRIAEASFAASIARHFDLATTFSVEALVAPAFAGLSRLAGARGRVAFDHQEFAVGEVVWGEAAARAVPTEAILIAVARDDAFVFVHRREELNPGDRTLIIVPLALFEGGKETFAAVAERVFDG